jgi:DNA-binding MarR family transcriptional regulator
MNLKNEKNLKACATSIVRGTPPECMMAMSAYTMTKLSQYLQERFEALLDAKPLRARHFGVLHALISAGPLTQQTLCEKMWIDRASMVGVIDGLEQVKFVKRKENPEDKRSHLISVTAAGRKFHREKLDDFQTLESKVFPSMSGKDWEKLRELLRQMMNDVCL